ncbi:hypothetical protein [Anaeromyxobacter oryzae]|uniref:Lipoprotein n=1 Tax=Anaeromyxobacter oryzae TaxID=2918170 RepID=A0ABM7WT93_9BACT|nr:hypothetical protein [Anaeromyxobacter oryzae]BDG02711.1 hypothetical protein AMOR_17070 [Anaeromyxobacter oryzae]
MEAVVLGRATAALVLAAAALALPGCTCGGRQAGPPPERFLPAKVDAAVIVPEAGRAARELAALHATIAGFPGAPELVQARGALTAQLGFDPLDPDALEGAGVEPRRGAAVAAYPLPGRAEPAAAALLVLPVRDADRLGDLFARIARDRLGAGLRSSELRGETSVVVFSPAPGTPPALAYAVVERTALVAAGPFAVDVVAAAATRRIDESLAATPAWKTARAALGERYAAILFAPPGSRRLAGLWAVKDGIALATSGSAAGARLGAVVLLGDREPSFRELSAGGAAARLVGRLDPGAPLALRWDGDPSALGRKLLFLLPARERARLGARGVDPQRDVLDVLAPGAAAVLSIPPNLDLTTVSEDTARTDPLLVARFEAVLPVKDPAAALAVSERLAPHPRRAGRGRAQPAPADAKTFRIATPSGEIAWRVDEAERRIALAGGPTGALALLEARLAGDGRGFEAPTMVSAAALQGGLGGAVLDPQRLVASVRRLPDDAFGTGPSGFVVRSVVDRFLEPAARLSAVSLQAELADGALVLALDVEAAAPGARP